MSGAVIWIVISVLMDKKEAWDSDLFWTFGFIGMLLINAIIGFIEPTNNMFKGFSAVSLQSIMMITFAGVIGSMFPMGLFVFAILGIIYSVGGVMGAFVKTRLYPMKGKSVHD